jgi:hypothetical protein
MSATHDRELAAACMRYAGVVNRQRKGEATIEDVAKARADMLLVKAALRRRKGDEEARKLEAEASALLAGVA